MKLVTVKKKNPVKPEDPEKYYVQTTVSGEVTFETIARRIAKNTMAGRGDVLGVLASLVDEIIESLEEGNTVRMGDLGCMRVSVSSKGVDDPDKVSAANVKKARIIFVPSVMIKDRVSRINFRQATASSKNGGGTGGADEKPDPMPVDPKPNPDEGGTDYE